MKDVKSTINANGVEIRVASSNEADYIYGYSQKAQS